MACPKCGCKVTYTYCEDDILGLPGDQERKAERRKAKARPNDQDNRPLPAKGETE